MLFIGASLLSTEVARGTGGTKAYVMIGNSAEEETRSITTALEAKADFEKAGYMVCYNSTASKQQMKDALNDPMTGAIWFMGHGNTSGTKKGDIYLPGIVMTDGDFGPYELGAATFPCITSVTLHACGQKQDYWKARFPMAEFNSWCGGTNGFQTYWWQYFHSYESVDGSQPKTPMAEERFWGPRIQLSGGGFEEGFNSPLESLFALKPGDAAAFGNRTFNVIGTDDAQTTAVTLLGVKVVGGSPAEADLDGYSSPDFEVTLPYSVMHQALEHPSVLRSLYDAGQATVTVHASGLPSSSVLFDGFAASVFGVNAVAEPSSAALIALGCCLAGRRRKTSH